MQIFPVSFSKINNINIKPQKQNQLFKSQNDVFVKSNNGINFTARKITGKLEPFKNEITQYVLQNNDYSPEEIQAIFQKYSPETSFRDFSSLPSTTNAHEATAGYTEQKIGFMMGNDGKLQLQKLPKTVYIMFPKTDSFDDKVIFLDRLIHESTHVFSADYKKGSESEELMENYLKSATDIQKTLNTLKISQQIFNSVEKEASYMLVASNKNIKSLPKNISQDENINKLFIKNFHAPADVILKQLIGNAIKKASYMCNFDKKFVIDFIVSKADEEKQAYQNTLNSDKSLLGLKGKTDFDLRIELYESLIKAAQKLR